MGKSPCAGSTRGQTAEEAALGLLSYGAGRLSLFGDSNCLDSSHQKSNCHAMLKKLLEFATEVGEVDRWCNECTAGWLQPVWVSGKGLGMPAWACCTMLASARPRA